MRRRHTGISRAWGNKAPLTPHGSPRPPSVTTGHWDAATNAWQPTLENRPGLGSLAGASLGVPTVWREFRKNRGSPGVPFPACGFSHWGWGHRLGAGRSALARVSVPGAETGPLPGAGCEASDGVLWNRRT